MTRFLLAFLILFGLATPAAAQRTLFVAGDTTATCNASGGGAACSTTSTYTGLFASTSTLASEYGYATAGATLTNLQSQVTAMITAKPASGVWVVSVDVGDDLGETTYANGTAYYNALVAITDPLRAAGAKVVISTILPSNNADATKKAKHNTDRLVFNNLVRNANLAKFDGIVDLAVIKGLGEDASAASGSDYTGGVPNASGHAKAETHYRHVITQSLGVKWDHPDWQDGSIPAIDFTVAAAKVGNETAVFDTWEPAEALDLGFTVTDWIVGRDSSSYVRVDPTIRERKFRITCDVGTPGFFDPLLYYAQQDIGHRHQGIGNFKWSPLTYYGTLRSQPGSSCTGGPGNGVIYWAPAGQRTLANGAVAHQKPNIISFYYIGGLLSEANRNTWLRRNFRFITGAGFNDTGQPNDYNDTARRAMYANAGLVYPGGPDTPAGFAGWQCYRGSDGAYITVSRIASRMKGSKGQELSGYARHLKAEDGSDPWGGACTGSDAQPGNLIINLYAQQCWDQHNGGSHDGMSHVAFAGESADGTIQGRCPTVVVNGVRKDFVQVPALQVKEEFRHTGFSGGSAPYGELFFASDRMNPSGTAPDTQSKDPCRATGPWYCNGSTVHADWWYGWQATAADLWQRECLGIAVCGVAPVNGPAECGDSQLSIDKGLHYGPRPSGYDDTMSCASVIQCSTAQPGQPGFYHPLPKGTPVPGAHSHTLGGGMASNDNQVNFSESFGVAVGAP